MMYCHPKLGVCLQMALTSDSGMGWTAYMCPAGAWGQLCFSNRSLERRWPTQAAAWRMMRDARGLRFKFQNVSCQWRPLRA